MPNKIKVLAFTSCGHCPISRTVLLSKMDGMEVYCFLQLDKKLAPKLVYKGHYAHVLDEGCPLHTIDQLKSLLGRKKDDNKAELVDKIHRIQFAYQTGPRWCYDVKDLDLAMPNRLNDGPDIV